MRRLRVVHIFGSANGNRTRISALKGPRANRCTIAPQWEFREMRHSIIGERDGIDKERAEIGMRGLWVGCRAQKIMLGHGLLRRVCGAGFRATSKAGASGLRRVDIGLGR